jgi:ribosomal protein S12 methylthiotransferase accessory factor
MSEIPEILISFPGGQKVSAEAFGHIIETDQSRRAGGEGSAPEPFALFLASIGTCAGIYVLSFLQSRGLSTKGLQIRQRLHFDPTTGLLAGVDLDIEVPDSVPEKYHAAIRRAADMCAVKKVIAAQPRFNIEVSFAAAKVAA